MILSIRKALSIALFLTFTIVLTLTVHSWMQTDVSFFNETISCSLSGTYTKKMFIDGTHTWEPSEPSSATVTAWGTAKGIGHAFVELSSGSVYVSNCVSKRWWSNRCYET